MVELDLSSEFTGLINFVVCDIFVMAYVIYASSVIAGFINYLHIKRGKFINLSAFDFPHVGGGLVMGKRRIRFLLIFLRASALAAVAISNFGLEGRTTTDTEVRSVTVRRPGKIGRLTHDTLFEATEKHRRCAQTVDNDLVFGAVLDGLCYQQLDTDVYIRSMSLEFKTFTTSALECERFPNSTFHATVYHCKDVDISCLGTIRREHRQEKGRCRSVLYENDGAWLCPFVGARPGVKDDEVRCRFMAASRQAIEGWTEVFRFQTEDLETSLFGAAYGVETQDLVRIPIGQRNITVVTLFWFIPAAWELVIVVIITVWAIGLRIKATGHVANDERGLLRLIKRRINAETLTLEDWLSGSSDDMELCSNSHGRDDMGEPGE